MIGLIFLVILGGHLHGTVQRFIILNTSEDDPIYDVVKRMRHQMMWGVRLIAAYSIYTFFVYQGYLDSLSGARL